MQEREFEEEEESSYLEAEKQLRKSEEGNSDDF